MEQLQAGPQFCSELKWKEVSIAANSILCCYHLVILVSKDKGHPGVGFSKAVKICDVLPLAKEGWLQ